MSFHPRRAVAVITKADAETIADVNPLPPHPVASDSDEKLDEKYSVSERADSPPPGALYVKGEPVIQTGKFALFLFT